MAVPAGAFSPAQFLSPVTARRYGIRSVPTVLGFRDGRLVAEFQGAQPETVVKRFLRALLPSEAARAVRSAEELAGGGHVAEATARFREALDLDASHPRALLGLARLLPDRDEALGLLEHIVGEPEIEREAERLAAELRTRSENGGDESSWRQRVEADPEDLEARLELGRALAAKGEYEEALGHLLEVVRRKPDYADEAARRAMLDVFSLLGNDDPLTQRFRRELARSLFR